MKYHFHEKFSWKWFHEKNAKKISLLMSKTMRKKKMKRYVQNLPYMHHDENSFRKSQISVTHSLAFQDILKLLLYCYRYTTTTILFKLQLHNIITTILWIVKKSIFQSFCYCFSAPKIIVDLNLWQWETVSKHPTCNIIHTNFTIKKSI